MVLWLALAPQSSMAVITINVRQVGADVTMTMSGSAKKMIVGQAQPPTSAGLVSTSVFVGSGDAMTEYYPISGNIAGPASMSTLSNRATPSSVTGHLGGIFTTPESSARNRNIRLPPGYVAGTPINGTATYSGQSLCGLGLTPGTLTWTWGTGASADSLVLIIDPPPAGPPPTVTSITPASGSTAGGTSLKIAGTDFCGVTGITVGGRCVYAI